MSIASPHPRTLVLRWLTTCKPGDEVSINDLADVFTSAGFTPTMRAAAMKWAKPHVENTYRTVPNTIEHAAKRRQVSVYRVVSIPTPDDIEAAA